MTLGQLIRILVRRWYIVVGVLVVTAISVVLVARIPGVYSAQASVRLLTPSALTGDANTIGARTEGLVEFAGLVEKAYNGNSPRVRFSSPDATLAGVGVRSGVSVHLLNSGGQWNLSFQDPLLVVDVVDPDSARALAMLDAAVADLVRIVDERQVGVDRANRVGVLVTPDPPVVNYLAGARSRSAAATVLLGVGAAVVAAVSIDRLANRRRARRETAASPRLS